MPRQHRRNCIAQIVRQFLEEEAKPKAKVYYLKAKQAPRRAVSELRRQLTAPAVNREE